MHILSHLSYPYIVANVVALLVGKPIPLEYNLLILFFSLFPDFDIAVDFIYQMITKKKYKVPDNHHHLPTHWPVVYLPLVIIAIATLNTFFIIATGAIYVHLIMDTFFCSQGVMLFYPFSKKWYIFFSSKTKHKKGLDWNKAYSTLAISKIDKWAFLLVLIYTTMLLV